MSYFYSTKVTNFFLHTSYDLLFIARVISDFLHTSYELLFIARVTSYILTVSYDKKSDDNYAMTIMIIRLFFDKELGVRKALFSFY